MAQTLTIYFFYCCYYAFDSVLWSSNLIRTYYVHIKRIKRSVPLRGKPITDLRDFTCRVGYTVSPAVDANERVPP